MKIALLICLLLGMFMVTYSQNNDYEQLKTEAEKFYQEKSYSRANEIYQKASQLKLSEKDTRWVKFRLADTLWRSQAASSTPDSTKFDKAFEQLNILVRDIKREQDRDLVWAEVQESIGDFFWQRNNSRNWGQATNYYLVALDFWAGSKDLKLARSRYLKIIFSSARPTWAEPYYYYGYYGNVFSPQILENALKLSETDNEKAHAYYLLAMATRYNGDNNQRLRVPEQFEAAIKFGKGSDWYDDALFYYAEWLQNYGKVTFSEDGQTQTQIDYAGALKLYRQIITDYKKGETRYFDQAQQKINEITKAYVQIGVSNFFLPESEVQFSISYRNLNQIDLALYKVDLTEHVRFTEPNISSGSWLQQIKLDGREKVKAWTKTVENKGDYKPVSENIILDQKLAVGAYVIEGKSGSNSSRELILVTNTALLVKTSGKQVLTYFNNAIDGAPVAGATVKLWQRYYNNTINSYVWKELNLQTNQDGIAVFDITTSTTSNQDIFVSATRDNRQAFSLGYNYYNSYNNQPWRIYAFTDRPAYRPKEEAKWKFIARRYNGSVYSTPANEVVEFEVTDPKGSKVKEGKTKLNAFGSAWDSLALTETMPLGEYRIQFWDEGKHTGIGSATLFRIEEYKLPEFKVSVKTPEEDGKRKAFRVGEKVEVNIQADYYFGGAVANATVQVLVYQNPFYHYYRQPRDYAWYYEDFDSRYNYNYGNGQIIKQETLKTDQEGKAKLVFETPNYGAQDYEYRIEARVTDSSRREIIGSEKIRVTNQRYYVYLNPERYLCRPEDNLKIKIKTIDANDQAVPVEGNIKLVRDYWYDIWLDPNDKEVKGEELEKIRRQFPQFPPPTEPGQKPWRLKFRGYEHEEILTDKITTNKNGEAEFNAKPPKVGYYRLEWASKDKGRAPITTQTTFWALNNQTTELGYRYNTVQMILDKDTVKVGQKASVMITVPSNDRYVLFSTEADDLYSYQLLHLTGTVQLVEIPIEQKHVPNIFLQAMMVWDRQVFTDQKQLIVPPTQNFLTVDVKSDREQYQPREEGTFTINARDENGQGVAAEIALGLVDESVFYIQSDYAGDPRQFYFGTKRSIQVQNFNTFQQKRYLRLVAGQESKQLIEEGQLQELRTKKREQGEYDQDGAGNRLAAAESVADVSAQSSAEFGRAEGKAGAMRANAPQPATAPAKSLAKKRDSGAKDDERVGGDSFKEKGQRGGEGGQEPPVQVRSDFRSTVFWQPDVTTDAQGKAVVKIKYPDNLTGWKAVARVVTTGTQFGIAEAATRTKQPLIVRLQAPRFFLVGDLTVVSAVINNNTDKAMTVAPSISTAGVTVTGLFKDGKSVKGEQGQVEVAANGETRVDWVVSASKAGDAKVKVTALNKTYSDAMENSYIVYEHGIEKFVAKSGKMRGNELTVSLNIPKERKPETTNLVVQVAPSMAVTMLDALPYLIDYPYGCTEQTMSRFLPAAIMAKTLRDLGLSPETVMGRYFGGIEQQFVNKTQPKGKKDLAKLNDMVNQGLNRLYDFQHSDGGWGWWKEGESDHFMTAYVLWGMTLAYYADIDLKFDSAKRAADYLNKELVEEESNFDQQAWMLHALTVFQASVKNTKPSEFQLKAFNNIWENRDKLNAYTRALLALSAHHLGERDKAMVLVRNLEDGVKRDNTPDVAVIDRGVEKSNETVIGTAHWGEDGLYYRWSDGGIEATSFVLRALLTIDPQNKLIEPVTNWLVKNRRGAQWSNTRDTAITILTLNDYLKTSGELKPDLEYELLVNGKLVVTKKLSGEDALAAPSQFPIDRKMIVDGANEIRIRRKGGNSALYFAAQATFFSLENPIPAAGNEIFARRDYYKLVSKPTLLKGFVYEKEQMQDKDKINSGDRIQVVLTIEAKNNYEYLLFEDLKPAGIEAVQIRSGEALYTKELKSGAIEKRFASPNVSSNSTAQPITEVEANNAPQRKRPLNPEVEEMIDRQGETDNLPDDLSSQDYTGRSRWVYQELRDRKVALFIDKLPEGVWEIRYEFRAETPGEFHALPVLGHAMYVPEIRCNSKEIRITVTEEKK